MMKNYTAAGKTPEGVMTVIRNIQAEDKQTAKAILTKQMPQLRLITILDEDEVEEIKHL